MSLDANSSNIRCYVFFPKAVYPNAAISARDGPWLNPAILLTRSKWEADPFLTKVLFDLTRRDFFEPKGKNWIIWCFSIFQTQTQTKDGWSAPTRATKNWHDPTRVKGPITISQQHLPKLQKYQVLIFPKLGNRVQGSSSSLNGKVRFG